MKSAGPIRPARISRTSRSRSPIRSPTATRTPLTGDVTLSSGDCALPTALGNQATAPVTAFQCAIARMRWMWVARAERL